MAGLWLLKKAKSLRWVLLPRIQHIPEIQGPIILWESGPSFHRKQAPKNYCRLLPAGVWVVRWFCWPNKAVTSESLWEVSAGRLSFHPRPRLKSEKHRCLPQNDGNEHYAIQHKFRWSIRYTTGDWASRVSAGLLRSTQSANEEEERSVGWWLWWGLRIVELVGE